MTEPVIRAIEAALSKGQRVELIPIENGGVIVTRIRRETVRVQRDAAPAGKQKKKTGDFSPVNPGLLP